MSSEKNDRSFSEMEADIGEEYFSPIGGKSNLANEDWNFINENPDLFKDWKYLAAFKFATEGKPITELTGKEFQKVQNESIVTRVLDYYTDLYNNEVERKEIGVVTLDKEGIKDSLAHGMSSLKATAYAAVPKVIKSGIIYNYERNWKNRNYDTCVIIAPINIGGKVFAEEVVLKKRPNKTGFYLHEVELKEKLLEMFKTPTERSKAKSYLIIARHFDKVKNCNVILNENYEPAKEYVEEIRNKQIELSRLDAEAEAMERANGLREMDYVMPDPDTIQDYHSELVNLGYKIINWEDGSGHILDSNGKEIVAWDKSTSEYQWAGKSWTYAEFDWPDFEKEIYLNFEKEQKEIRTAQTKLGDIVRGTFLALSDEEKKYGITVEKKKAIYEKWYRPIIDPMVDEIMAEIGCGNKEVMAILHNFDLNHESVKNKVLVEKKLLPEMYEKVQDRIKKEYEEKKIPYVVMYSSESHKFPSDNKVYTVKEFNEILLQADSEFHNRKKYAEEKYGSADNYWDLDRDDKLPEEDKGIQFVYDTTNFKFFNIPNPNNPEDTFSYEPGRYDIGDGNGSVFDYVRTTCSHDDFIEALNALETQLYFPGVTNSQRHFVEKTVEEATQNLKATLKEKMEDLDKAQNEYKELHKKWHIEATEADRVDEILRNALDGIKETYDNSMNDVFTKVLNEYPFASGDVAGSEFLKYTANEVKKMAVSELYLPSRNAQKAMNAEDYKTYNSIDWAKLRRIWEKFPANVNMTAYAEKLLQDKCAEKGMSVSENTKAVTPPTFSDEPEIMRDFFDLSKDEFLASYLDIITEEEYDATFNEIIHTEEFISRFGDWEKAQRLEKLKNAESLETDARIILNEEDITDTVVSLIENEDRKSIQSLEKEIGKTVVGKYDNRDTGLTFNVSNRNVTEISNHHYLWKEHIKAISLIPQISEKAIFIGEEGNEDKKRNPNIVTYKYFAAGIKIDGDDYTCKVVIGVDNSKNCYYDQSLSTIEKGKLIDILQEKNKLEADNFELTKEEDNNLSPLMTQRETTSSCIYYDKRLINICQVPQMPYLDEDLKPTLAAVQAVHKGLLYMEKKDQQYVMKSLEDKTAIEVSKNVQPEDVQLIGNDLSKFLSTPMKDLMSEKNIILETKLDKESQNKFSENQNKHTGEKNMEKTRNEYPNAKDVLNNLEKKDFTGYWIPAYNANLILKGLQNGNSPLAPDEDGKVTCVPIYNANTGFMVEGNKLIPLQIKKIESGYESNVVGTTKSIVASGTQKKSGEKGVWFNFKDKNSNEIHQAQFIFPEQMEKPEKFIDYSNKLEHKGKEKNWNGLADKKYLADKTLVIDRGGKYLAAYFANGYQGLNVMATKKAFDEFVKEITPILENEKKGMEKDKKIMSLNDYVFNAEKEKNEIIKSFNSDRQVKNKIQKRENEGYTL